MIKEKDLRELGKAPGGLVYVMRKSIQPQAITQSSPQRKLTKRPKATLPSGRNGTGH